MARLMLSLAFVLGAVGISNAQQPMMPGPGMGYNYPGAGAGGMMQANYMGGGVGPVANPYAVSMAPPAAAGPSKESSRFGFNPVIKRLFHIKEDCGACKAPKPPTGGTLVFPNQPFIRSPRDLFMEDGR